MSNAVIDLARSALAGSSGFIGELIWWALSFAFVLPAIILHEVAHGYAAFLLGDDTARRAGRLTLNPLKHIDAFGTLAMPALLLLISGGTLAFGYAKPVPVNAHRFHNYRVGLFLTGIAGPVTNLTLAILAGLLTRVLAQGIALNVAVSFAMVNLTLMFFNLIPVPPLDGSRVIPLFLTDRGLQKYAQVERYGFAIMIGLIWVVPRLLPGVDPLGVYLNYTVDPVLRLITGL